MNAKRIAALLIAMTFLIVSVPMPLSAAGKKSSGLRRYHAKKKVSKKHTHTRKHVRKHRRPPGPAVVETKELNPSNFHAGLVADIRTDSVFFVKNVGERRPIASLTKLMLAFIVSEKVDHKEARWTDMVTISKNAGLQGGSQVYLKEGEQFTLGELMKAVMVKSANDAAFAISEYFGSGDNETFIAMMNQRARQLGMNDTIFFNANGLPPAKIDAGRENISTARDLYILAKAIIRHPVIFHFTSIKKDTFRDGTFTLVTSNKLLLKDYPGLDGLKTGYTRNAGFSFIATAKRGNTRLVAIVLGATSNSERFNEAARLLDIGFEEIYSRRTASAGSVRLTTENQGVRRN